MNFSGKELRETRGSLGLSQAKLAELTEIPQHIISSFELGKSELSSELKKNIITSLDDKEKISGIIKRKKRYRDHEYKEFSGFTDRSCNAVKTSGNSEYIKVLNELGRKHFDTVGKRFSAISLFSGCGGFSLGFSSAGFDVKGFLELDPGLRDIYKENFPDSIEMGGDITEIGKDDFLRYHKIFGEVDVIIGGPPCQGFSLSGKRDVNDPRNNLFKNYLGFVDAFRPKIAIMENVRLLSSMKNLEGGLVKLDIEKDMKSHGYNVKSFEVNAKEYGVPQHRERIIFIAIRDDLKSNPSIPNPHFGDEGGEDFFAEKSPCRTFGDACSDLEFIESGEKGEDPFHKAVKHPSHVIEWLWNVPEGRSAHDNEDVNLRPPSGYNTTYKRQVWREPAATVQTTFGMISGCRNVHPIATRSLTIREAARIQSFPDSYRFKGKQGTIRTGIGNAVPPLLAYKIGLHIEKVIENL